MRSVPNTLIKVTTAGAPSFGHDRDLGATQNIVSVRIGRTF